MKKRLLGLTVALSAVLALTACGGGEGSGSQTLEQIQENYPAIVENDGEAIKGGTLKVGIVSDSALTGVFNPFFSQTSDDDAVMAHTMAGAVEGNENFQMIQDSDETPLNIHINGDEKSVSIKINPKFKWNDGEPVTTADIVKTFEIVASAEYEEAAASVRFDGAIRDVEGIMDYYEGKADKISGLEVKSPSEMVIHYTEMTPSILYGKGMPGDFVKAKSVEGVAMKDIPSCAAFRKNPPSYGPFVITNIVQGQRVSFDKNPYYYKGEPKIDHVDMEIIPSSQMVANMQTGGYDIYLTPNKDAFDQFTNLENVKVASRPSNSLALLNFKQGHWDFDKGECVFDPEAKMSNPSLKKAMAMAIDTKMIGEKFNHGLTFPADSPIAPMFKDLRNPEVKAYGFDMEAAKKLLDDAGYVDVDGDGLREDPNGNKLEITYVATSGGETAEPIAKYKLQQWGLGESGDGSDGLGLNVKLYNDRLIDIHQFWDMLDNDSQEMDVFDSGFTLGSDPCQAGLFSKYAMWNDGRYTSETLQNAIDATNSAEALDPEKAKELYHEYDKVFHDEVPVIPVANSVEIIVVNNRVKHYDFNHYSPEFDWSKLELTAEKPIGA